MDPWQIVGFLVVGIIQLLGFAAVFFITRQGRSERDQGSQRETVASLSEKIRSLRTDVDALRDEHDESHTSLTGENSKVKDQLAQLAGQFAAFVAESRGQWTSIADKLALRDDRIAAMENQLIGYGQTMKEMSISLATMAERWNNLGPPSGQSESRAHLTEADRRVISLLRQMVRDEA